MNDGRARTHMDGLVVSICLVAVVAFAIGLWIGAAL